jgi:hypothetical protein
MCAREATSREHAPPRCLFPEAKDVPDGKNHRKNLLTVPSCDLHNSAKSQDDEYLLFALAGSYTSSGTGLTQFLTKVRRAFSNQPSKAGNFVKISVPVQLRRSSEDEWEHGAQITLEWERIDSVLSNCARALYHHHTQSKFQGPEQVLTYFTKYLDDGVQASASAAFNTAAIEMVDEPLRGENPKVFSYKFKETPSMITFYFCFYGSSSAIVRFRKILRDR